MIAFVCSRRVIIAGAVALSASWILGFTRVQSAPAAKSAAKKPAKSSAKKPAKPIPGVAGLKLKGSGKCIIEAKMTNDGANLVQSSFRTRRETERTFTYSSGTAAVNNNIAVIIMLPRTERKEISAQLLTEIGASMTFVSRHGFKSGQSFPIEHPTSKKVGTGVPLSLMDMVQYEYKVEKKSDLGRQRSKTRYSSWIAKSGTVRLESVSPQRVTFSIKNARFVTAKPKTNDADQARGSFVLNGIGEFLITEVDDGFR